MGYGSSGGRKSSVGEDIAGGGVRGNGGHSDGRVRASSAHHSSSRRSARVLCGLVWPPFPFRYSTPVVIATACPSPDLSPPTRASCAAALHRDVSQTSALWSSSSSADRAAHCVIVTSINVQAVSSHRDRSNDRPPLHSQCPSVSSTIRGGRKTVSATTAWALVTARTSVDVQPSTMMPYSAAVGQAPTSFSSRRHN